MQPKHVGLNLFGRYKLTGFQSFNMVAIVNPWKMFATTKELSKVGFWENTTVAMFDLTFKFLNSWHPLHGLSHSVTNNYVYISATTTVATLFAASLLLCMTPTPIVMPE